MVKIVGWKECIDFRALHNEIIPHLHIHNYTMPRVLGRYISICNPLRELAISVNFPTIYKQIDLSYSWSPCGIGTLNWCTPEYREIEDDLAVMQKIGENYGTGHIICDLAYFRSAPHLVILTFSTFEHLTELRITLDCRKFDAALEVKLHRLQRLEVINTQKCKHLGDCHALMGLLQCSTDLESIKLEKFVLESHKALDLLIPSQIKELSLRDTGVPLDVLNSGLLNYIIRENNTIEWPSKEVVSIHLHDSLQVMKLMSNLSVYEVKQRYYYSITINCANHWQTKVVRQYLFRCMEFMCLLYDSLATQSLHDQCQYDIPHASKDCMNTISTLCGGNTRKPISSFIHFINNKSCSIFNVPTPLNM